MARRTLIVAATLLGLGHALETCGQAQYDPAQHVCWDNQFLCPVIAGEPLSHCAGACYSKFMYTCANNVLALLPPVDTPFSLTADNPTLPIHGKPVTASGQHWLIDGQTSSYCPSQVGSGCPPGDVTGIVAGDGRAAMNVMVPGGQLVYLDPYWNVAYTQAHSAYIPSGSTTAGFAAYKDGGFVNLNGNGWGWVACPPRASGPAGSAWNLVAKNETNAAILNGCTAVNLKVNPLPAGASAWQYT